jgi:hypothetical protein
MISKSTIRSRKCTLGNVALIWLLQLDERIETSHFLRNVIRAVARGGGDFGLKQSLQGFRVVPDAYLIEERHRTVYAFEIEDTHEIDINKLRSLAWHWFCLDSEGWEFRVFVLDRYLQNWRIVPLDRVYFALFEWEQEDKSGRPTWGKTTPIDWDKTFIEVRKSSLHRPVFIAEMSRSKRKRLQSISRGKKKLSRVLVA